MFLARFRFRRQETASSGQQTRQSPSKGKLKDMDRPCLHSEGEVPKIGACVQN